MIDWDRVRVFRGVAEAGSFTRAAESLGLSQSAISRQIGALEEDLRTSLFHRHARGLVLTEQGEILLSTANEVAKRMAAVETALGESRDSPAGHLRVNATVGIGTVWLVARLPDFLAKLKHGDLVVITADHGCDPTAPGSDHTREHIPMIFFGPNVAPQELPIANTFSDIGATLAKHLGVKPLSNGTALL